MSDNEEGGIHRLTEGGVTGKHPAPDLIQFLVGPTTSNEFNTVRLRLIPIACFRVDDMRFKFDSSFVLPEIQTEMSAFAALRASDPRVDGAPISIFGHADPSFEGNFELTASTHRPGDDYNKILSGRRATAIYALLTREPGLWDDLFTNHLGGDVWGDDAIRIMLDVTGRSDGSAGQRRQLFLSYMNALCGDLKLNKSNDFLARGADPGLKGDLQGCSRFNPLLIFSREKEDLFKTANRQRDKLVLGQRNDEDAPNRRVMVLIFRKGSRVLPAKWPCPTVKEGVGGCLKRFFSDGDARRSTHLSGTDGQFDQSHDTFACRFYQRISDQSPCNKTQKFALVRLYDGYQQFIPFAPFEATIGNRAPIRGTADDEGVAIIADAEIPSSCEIRWGFKPDQGVRPVLLFSRTIFLVASDETGDDTVQKKLSNLGYRDDDSATNIVAFQLDYGHLTDPFLTATGELGDATLDLLEKVYAEAANDLRRTQI